MHHYLDHVVFFEMARPIDNILEPGYELWVKRFKDGMIQSAYFFGTSVKDKKTGWFGNNGDFQRADSPSIRKELKKKGYRQINTSKLSKGKGVYATGKQKSGRTVPYTGKLFHGTKDIDFFESTYNSSDFGYGSHLKSLKEGDAFSLTPNFEIAERFSSDPVGMVIEFAARNLQVYYASPDEEIIDQIDTNDDIDAVAIPYGRYQEDEFALIKWDDLSKLEVQAVHLPMKKDGWKRYAVRRDRVEMFGWLSEFGWKWMEEIFEVDGLEDLIGGYLDLPRYQLMSPEIVDGNTVSFSDGSGKAINLFAVAGKSGYGIEVETPDKDFIFDSGKDFEMFMKKSLTKSESLNISKSEDGKVTISLDDVPTAKQEEKIKKAVSRATSVDLDVVSTSHRDYDHYKQDRKDKVLPHIHAFYKTNRIPPFEGLASMEGGESGDTGAMYPYKADQP